MLVGDDGIAETYEERDNNTDRDVRCAVRPRERGDESPSKNEETSPHPKVYARVQRKFDGIHEQSHWLGGESRHPKRLEIPKEAPESRIRYRDRRVVLPRFFNFGRFYLRYFAWIEAAIGCSMSGFAVSRSTVLWDLIRGRTNFRSSVHQR